MLVTSVLTTGCSGTATRGQVLTCHDAKDPRKDPWVLRIDDDQQTAEMIVHVPEQSMRAGVPAGNRRGHVTVSERAYSITIPADSGGVGDKAWSRLQFAFQIDRYARSGKLRIGEERYGDTPSFDLRCEAGPASPKL